jgi:rhomboid protease GluP
MSIPSYSQQTTGGADYQQSAPPPPPQTTYEVRFPQGKAVVTWVILGVTVIMYLLQVGSQALTGYDLPMIYGAKINEYIIAGQIWRLFTPVLLHGSIIHIAFNMYALYAIGPTLERAYGHGRFLILYVLTGFAGNVMSFLLSANPSLGSSTAIFGLVAAEGVFVYQNKKFFGKRFKSVILNISMIVAVNLIIGLNPGIDNWGHVGGLLGGLVFSWLSGPIWEVTGIAPVFSITDTRPSSRVVLAGLIVLALFSALAVGKMILG